MPMTQAWNLLMWVVLPLWVLSGFGDYLCHRRSHIEHAAGVRESLIHWLMLLEVGVPLALAVFFRINALVLAAFVLFLLAHEYTGRIDLKIAMATREVSVFEHQIHSLLEVLPFTAVLLEMILHWPQTLALFGQGAEAPQWYFALKQPPAWAEIIPPAAAFAVLALAPYAEEFLRSWRASTDTQV
jgi:hypothetical protein